MTKKHRPFTVTIDDGFVAYAFELIKADEICIDDVANAIRENLKVKTKFLHKKTKDDVDELISKLKKGLL